MFIHSLKSIKWDLMNNSLHIRKPGPKKLHFHLIA